MSSAITLTYNGVTADLTNCNVSVQRVINNLASIIQTPVDGTTSNTNELAINIGLLQNQYYLTFDLKDGIGSLDWTSSATTTFEKLNYMARIKTGDSAGSYCVFTWYSGTKNVIITQFRGGTNPGQKSFLQGCSMTLQETGI